MPPIDHFMHKSDLPKPLQKYWDHQFSSGGVTGPDYKSFQTAYGRWLKKELAGYEVTIHKNHYEFSAVVKKAGKDGEPDQFVYLSISDVRFWPREWAYHILVRKMSHATDWSGGTNSYCQIDQIKGRVEAFTTGF